ncbi:hypothetical protein [Nocardia barduliensis]|uniref:hypothetical protein n=1 Tax=Nocardia barduliensis TaxID=2736643 RepID=UPI001C2DB0E8|nr:hypothetical protein [Nocardia barduliensis]
MPVSTTPVRTTTPPPIQTTAQPPNSSAPPVAPATTSVEIGPAPVVTTTAEDPTTTEPTGGRPPTTQPPDARQDSDAGDLLGLGGFLLALGAALLLVRARRKSRDGASPPHDGDPRPPQVGVQVVADTAPSIHIRQVVRAPAVRVRLRAGEPWLHVEEVHG